MCAERLKFELIYVVLPMSVWNGKKIRQRKLFHYTALKPGTVAGQQIYGIAVEQ